MQKPIHSTPSCSSAIGELACLCAQDAEGHVNWGVLLFSLLCVACGAVWLGLLHTWCALGSACLSCPRKNRQVSQAA